MRGRENTLLRHGGCVLLPHPSPETRPIQFLGRQLPGTRFLCRLRIRLDKKLSPLGLLHILFLSLFLSLSLELNRTIREYGRQRERGEVKIHEWRRDRKMFLSFSRFARYYRPRFPSCSSR